MTSRSLCLLLAMLLLAPTAVHAQTAWDSPLLLPPRAVDGVGLYLADVDNGGIGALVTWRSAVWNYGLRAGISEGPGDGDLALFGGIDYQGAINNATDEFPVDIDWVFGAGLGVSDGVRVSFPLGLSAAHTFRGDGATFTPYLTPRVHLDAWFGGDAGGEDADLGVALDLGLDLTLGGRGPLGAGTIRFAATAGDRSAVAIGFVF